MKSQGDIYLKISKLWLARLPHIRSKYEQVVAAYEGAICYLCHYVLAWTPTLSDASYLIKSVRAQTVDLTSYLIG